MVNHLHHFTTLNDHNLLRHTGTPDAFPTYQCITDQDNMSSCASLTGTNKNTSTNIDDNKTTTSPDKPYHHSWCILMSHLRAASNPLSPKAPSQPGMHLMVPQPITHFPKEAQPKMTSTLSPSSNSDSSLLSITTSSTPCSCVSMPSTSNDEAESLCSGYPTQSTRQLCPRLPITYNKTALMKLQGRPQV